MDPQVLITLAQALLGLIFILVCVNMYLVFKLKEIDPFANWNPNSINPTLFMIFCIGGLIAAFISSAAWSDLYILVFNPASEHGVEIDRMFWNTMYVTIFVVVVTNVLLFYYSWRYRAKPGRKALFYPHNNKLEMIWTVIPAIVLTLLVFDGVITWHATMREAPEDAIQFEVNGKQFAWTVRYPGADNEFGYASTQYINDASGNEIGFNFEDKRGHDDIITREIHLPVGVPVKMNIRSRDVLHSATLPHFRVKMDAVPGMPTSFWFTPIKTTAEMREDRQDPDFNYEMSCQQICGAAHWNMRVEVVVESMAKYQEWLNQQKPFYATWREANPDEAAAISARIEENDKKLAEKNELVAERNN